MTAPCSEIAQVRCDCLAQVDVAAIRRITQQVNAFFCQNLSSETFPCSYWKFIDCGNARHQRDAWSRARRPEVELISNACIRNCFYAAWHNLSPLRDEALQQFDILVVDLWRIRTRERARFPSTKERAPSPGAARRSTARLTFHLCLHRFRHRPLWPVGSLRCAVTTFVPIALTGAAPLAVVPAAPALHDHRRSILVGVDADGKV